MIKINFLLIILVSIATACNMDVCNNKADFISHFSKFIDEVEHKSKDFSKDDWKETDLRFEKFKKECFEKFSDQLNSEEETEVLRNTIKYSLLRAKGAITSNDELKRFKDYFDENGKFKEDIDKIIDSKNIKNSKEDFKNAMEDFSKGMEKIGKGLEKIGKELDKSFSKDSDNK